MKLNLFFGLFFSSALLITSCGETEKNNDIETTIEEPKIDEDAFLADLKELEDRINANLGTPNEADLKEAIVSYQDYAAIFPENDDAPEYLLKASDFALFTNEPQRSVKILSRIQDEYPDFAQMEDVMYNKASHLDFELRDTTNAKIAYQAFIEKYPNSELVGDAKSRIENIRYSLEELTQKFLDEMEENNDLP